MSRLRARRVAEEHVDEELRSLSGNALQHSKQPKDTRLYFKRPAGKRLFTSSRTLPAIFGLLLVLLVLHAVCFPLVKKPKGHLGLVQRRLAESGDSEDSSSNPDLVDPRICMQTQVNVLLQEADLEAASSSSEHHVSPKRKKRSAREGAEDTTTSSDAKRSRLALGPLRESFSPEKSREPPSLAEYHWRSPKLTAGSVASTSREPPTSADEGFSVFLDWLEVSESALEEALLLAEDEEAFCLDMLLDPDKHIPPEEDGSSAVEATLESPLGNLGSTGRQAEMLAGTQQEKSWSRIFDDRKSGLRHNESPSPDSGSSDYLAPAGFEESKRSFSSHQHDPMQADGTRAKDLPSCESSSKGSSVSDSSPSFTETPRGASDQDTGAAEADIDKEFVSESAPTRSSALSTTSQLEGSPHSSSLEAAAREAPSSRGSSFKEFGPSVEGSFLDPFYRSPPEGVRYSGRSYDYNADPWAPEGLTLWHGLNSLRTLLVKKDFSLADVHLLMVHVGCLIQLGKHNMPRVPPARTNKTLIQLLAYRFLLLDAVWQVCDMVGPLMNRHIWWNHFFCQVVGATPSLGTTVRERKSSPLEPRVLRWLQEALRKFERGQRPSRLETLRLKRALFCQLYTVRYFKRASWNLWRKDLCGEPSTN
ncbi:hypothetical protein ACSSS7_005687 [Eimeria intestinalis]